eukprot:1963403-Rhodomonas_salina.2
MLRPVQICTVRSPYTLYGIPWTRTKKPLGGREPLAIRRDLDRPHHKMPHGLKSGAHVSRVSEFRGIPRNSHPGPSASTRVPGYRVPGYPVPAVTPMTRSSTSSTSMSVSGHGARRCLNFLHLGSVPWTRTVPGRTGTYRDVPVPTGSFRKRNSCRLLSSSSEVIVIRNATLSLRPDDC